MADRSDGRCARDRSVSIWTFEWHKGINRASIFISANATQSVPQQPVTSPENRTGEIEKPQSGGTGYRPTVKDSDSQRSAGSGAEARSRPSEICIQRQP